MDIKNNLLLQSFILMLLLFMVPTQASTQFIHPGGLFKTSDMERMRYMVKARVEPWSSSYNILRDQEKRSSMHYRVRGNSSIKVVARGGQNGSAFESDANAAYLNALMWIVSQDVRHAKKCVQIFNAWKNLTEVTGGGTEVLNAGLFIWKMLEAAEIIKSTYKGWQASDIQAFKKMLVYPGYSSTQVPSSVNKNNGTFYWRIYKGDPGRHGNQDMIAWRAMLIMGVFLDNQKIYDRALRYFKGQSHRSDDLPYVSGPSSSEKKISDNIYFSAFKNKRHSSINDYGYNGVLKHYIWENGQCQESSRDQQHALFGLGIAAGIAEVAWNQGDPLWNWDNRLLKGFEFTARYNTSFIASYADQKSPWEPDHFIQRTDRTGRWYSKKMNPYFESDFKRLSRGDFPGKRPVFEQALAHFTVRMGMTTQAKWTLRARDTAVSKKGYERTGWSLDHPGWGALTFRRPPLCAGDPVSGFRGRMPIFKIPVLPATIEAENFDYFPDKGQGHTYHDTSSGNSGGAYRRNTAVDITSCSEGGYCLTDMDAGEWATYTIHVPSTGTYHVKLRYAAKNSQSRIHFAFGGKKVTPEISLPGTGGLARWTSFTVVPDIKLEAGVQSMQFFISGASDIVNLNHITVNKGKAPSSGGGQRIPYGDVNHDGKITIIDALLIAQHYVGLDPKDFVPDAADVNCNGKIDIIDAMITAKYYVKQLTSIGC